ncbi:MAG: hypothetical protein A2014_06250 [Spirochaetes bacterium GWF1_49_6]|jgi:hypothetical protein|nr:MAG: hypothetical protein A2014_06250 [Spirochaetes bacterium GWF1_49_6]
MNIKDVITGNVNLSALYEKSKYKSPAVSEKSGKGSQIGEDSFVFEKNLEKDMIRLQEVQKDYMKNDIGVKGLNDMQNLIGSLDGKDPEKIDWPGMTKKMNAIVSSTMYEGQSVIGFLSTKVEDEKSLYTLKMNVTKEISSMQAKMDESRKQIASYLVKRENIEVFAGYTPEKNVQSIMDVLDIASAQGLYKNIGNVNSLLKAEK